MTLKCPRCAYDLRGSVKPSGVTCPECGGKITQRDLHTLYHQPDRSGEPESLSPHETRASGWVVSLGIIIPLIAAIVIMLILITRAVL